MGSTFDLKKSKSKMSFKGEEAASFDWRELSDLGGCAAFCE
jgi:hypothetical protein